MTTSHLFRRNDPPAHRSARIVDSNLCADRDFKKMFHALQTGTRSRLTPQRCFRPGDNLALFEWANQGRMVALPSGLTIRTPQVSPTGSKKRERNYLLYKEVADLHYR